MARRATRRHRLGHVDAAGRVSGCPGGFHGDGRMANFARARSDAPRRRHRNPRLRDSSLHRQDRHADREQDDDHANCDGADGKAFSLTEPPTRQSRMPFRIWSRSAFSQARASRSIRWRRRFTRCGGRRASAEGADGHALEFVRAYGLRPDLLAVTQVWRPASGDAGSSSRPKARRKPSQSSAELAALDATSCSDASKEMAAEGLRVLGVARAVHRRRRAAGFAARICVRFRRAGRTCRSAAAERCRGGEGMPIGGHSRHHDHRRLSRRPRLRSPARRGSTRTMS